MKSILLTRSDEENLRLSGILEEYGLHSIFCPQIIRKEIELDFSAFKSHDTIVVTSKFAAKIVSQKVDWLIKAYVVGEESANILKNNHYIQVQRIFLNVTDLSCFLSKEGVEGNNTLYLSGNYVTKDLPVKRFVIYNTIYTCHIDLHTAQSIRKGNISAVLFFSKETAISFKQALKTTNLTQYIANLYIITLSEEIALEFVDFGCNLLYCNKPSEQEIINLLKKAIYGTEKEKF